MTKSLNKLYKYYSNKDNLFAKKFLPSLSNYLDILINNRLTMQKDVLITCLNFLSNDISANLNDGYIDRKQYVCLHSSIKLINDKVISDDFDYFNYSIINVMFELKIFIDGNFEFSSDMDSLKTTEEVLKKFGG